MLKAILLEDEEDSRYLITSYLENLVELVAVTATLEEAYTAITTNKVDVVFLDIKIGEEEVFVLLDKLTSISFEIVFITAFSEYAIKAFELSATDYILKPLTQDRIQKVVEKISKAKAFSSQKFLEMQFDLLKNSLKEGLDKEKDITITIVHREKNQNKHSFINSRDIIALEADTTQTKFYLKSAKTPSYPKNIGYYEKLLPQSFFFRIHESYIINKREVLHFLNDSDGGYVDMSNQKRLPVSRHKKPKFLEWMNNND